jgi:hypothetical protein
VATPTTFTVVATDVNRLLANFNASHWNVNHNVEVDIVNDVVSSKKATAVISVTVVPCSITTATIATQTITVGNKMTYQFPVFTYTEVEARAVGNTCGDIWYEFVGTLPSWLLFDAATRTFTYYPKSTANQGTHSSFSIKAWSRNF